MSNYSRFWDIHLVAADEYDFARDIVEQVLYQRHVKAEHKIAQPALLIIHQLTKTEEVAAIAMHRIPKICVTFPPNLGGFVAVAPIIFEEYFKLHKAVPKVFLDSTRTAVVKVLKSKVKHAEFVEKRTDADIVISSTETEFSIQMGSEPVTAADTIAMGVPSYDPVTMAALVDAKKDSVGYLGTTAIIADVRKAARDAVTERIIPWLLDGAPSKLRVTAHGDGEGNIEMGVSQAKKEKMPAVQIVEWLHANGLNRKGGLATFSVATCMAAKFGSTPATVLEDSVTAAAGSAVASVAAKLKEKGVGGVKVTGANEVTWLVKDDGHSTVEGKFAAGQNVRMIAIPAGWQFKNNVLDVPSGWQLEQKMVAGKSRLSISPTGAATVSVNAGTGWDFKLEKPAVTQVIPQAGWIVDIAKKEIIVADGWKQEGQKLRFSGMGGNVGIRSRSQGTVLEIIEGLAHSQAKVAVMS